MVGERTIYSLSNVLGQCFIKVLQTTQGMLNQNPWPAFCRTHLAFDPNPIVSNYSITIQMTNNRSYTPVSRYSEYKVITPRAKANVWLVRTSGRYERCRILPPEGGITPKLRLTEAFVWGLKGRDDKRECAVGALMLRATNISPPPVPREPFACIP